jgi:hypothetical protein
VATKLTLREARPARWSAGPFALAAALVTTGLLLPALAGAILAQGADPAGPEAPSAQQLIDSLRQIQGEVGGAQAGRGEVQAEQVPAPKLSEDQVRSRLQDELGVEVVGLRVVEVDGRPAYAVKVMNPSGNYDAAFLVSTLLVDGETGEILAQAPGWPTIADPDLLPESFRPDLDASGVEVRRRTYR